MNQIGIDINLAVEHVHMHSMLQFISGLGPRKAKKFISKMKKLDLKLKARSDLQTEQLLTPHVLFSAHAFMKIRVPREDIEGKVKLELPLLDQTRIHLESYKLANKLVADVFANDESGQKMDQQRMLREVIENPSKLAQLNLQSYVDELE